MTAPLIIGLRNYMMNYIKTGQQSKKIKLDNLTDPKACVKDRKEGTIKV